jgi:Ser/Thr protein kinase RdoA (MazF antagonist)
MNENNFQNRISYKGGLISLLQKIADDFGLGTHTGHKLIEVGYEDFNVILETDKGKHFVKMFANFKDEAECRRYVDIMLKALEVGVQHPRLYQSTQGYFHKLTLDDALVRLVVLEYIDGQSFYDLDELPNEPELRFLATQAALINQKMDIRPPQVYDSWAVVNFVKEYDEKKQYFELNDLEMMESVINAMRKADLSQLPHCFVHGDIIKTNVMRAKSGELYILDFSVSNYYPRVQELAVLLCDLFFNEKDPSNFAHNYQLALNEYQRIQPLNAEELAILPLYTKAAHAMHIVNPIYLQKAEGQNHTVENAKWLELGRVGLKFANEFWKN